MPTQKNKHRCKGKKRDGSKCTEAARANGFCGRHKAQAKPPEQRDRKIKPFQYDEIERLAELGCTQHEIAVILGISDNTISLHKQKDDKLRVALERGRMTLHRKLRAAQVDKALVERNTDMLKHLGKHYLNQRDHVEVTGKDGAPVEIKDAAAKLTEAIKQRTAGNNTGGAE